MPYGRTLLTTSKVFPTRVSADGRPKWKTGGITLDLTTIPTASASEVTLPDGSTIAANEQYLRYGQILCRIGVAEVKTFTWTGGATAGSAVITYPASGEYPAESTAAIAYNASAATFQTALQALSRIGANNVSVARSGAGSNADPYIYTATFSRQLGNVPDMTATHTFTGGTTPTVTIATTTSGGASAGLFGPYDPDATDGRATLTRGECFILDETWMYNPAGGGNLAGLGQRDIIGVFDGGEVWIERVLQSNAATHTIALGPTLTEFLTAFPAITLTRMNN